MSSNKTPVTTTTVHPLLDLVAWVSAEVLQAANNGQTLIPNQAGNSVVVIPAGLPVGFHCSMVNTDEVDIRSNSSTVKINGAIQTGVSFTGSLQFGVIHIRSYAQDCYSVTIEPQNEPLLNV